MNKSITLVVFAFVACSSKTPVDMEEQEQVIVTLDTLLVVILLLPNQLYNVLTILMIQQQRY